mgnify:CR=1 FL=1
MAIVSLSINGRIHEIACEDSQVARVHVLGQMIDGVAADLLRQLGNVPDVRLMVMVALTLADELVETRESLDMAVNRLATLDDEDATLADGIDSLAAHVEAIARKLERS